jgi:hypothetical protein
VEKKPVDELHITFWSVGAAQGGGELGHMTIDKKTLAVVDRKTTMKLDAKAFAKMIGELTGRSGNPSGRNCQGKVHTESGEIMVWKEDAPS